MSINQLHGKIYEDYLKAAFPGASDHGRLISSLWDIEKEYDIINNLPTSIKVCCDNIVGLSDARRIWSIHEPYRLLIGTYNQKDNVKEFNTLYEFQVSYENHIKLIGDISYKDIEEFHNNLLTFKFGQHIEARKWAKLRKKELQPYCLIQLNPKIDSKTQRRLQCSISIDILQQNIDTYNIFRDKDFYRGIGISFRVESGIREFINLSNSNILLPSIDIFKLCSI